MSSAANGLDTARGARDGRVPDAARTLVDFVPTKPFFAGIDSDGGAMAAMDIKHQECFTPCCIRLPDPSLSGRWEPVSGRYRVAVPRRPHSEGTGE